MTTPAPAPLWRGRALAVLGIVLVAANLRTAVATMSPIYTEIGRDVTLTAVTIGLLGMVPPIMFSLAGILSPRNLFYISKLMFPLGALVGVLAGLTSLSFLGSTPETAVLVIGLRKPGERPSGTNIRGTVLVTAAVVVFAR